MKKSIPFTMGLLATLIASVGILGTAAHADSTPNRDTLDKFDKDIAKTKEDISKKMGEIRAQQVKIDKDTSQYGLTSNEVKGDQDKLKDLRKDLGDQKADLYKDRIQRKIEAGEAIETGSSC